MVFRFGLDDDNIIQTILLSQDMSALTQHLHLVVKSLNTPLAEQFVTCSGPGNAATKEETCQNMSMEFRQRDVTLIVKVGKMIKYSGND